MDLPIEDYFCHAYRMSEAEIRIRDSLMEWLPDDIVDAHAHCNLREHVVEINPRARTHAVNLPVLLRLKILSGSGLCSSRQEIALSTVLPRPFEG